MKYPALPAIVTPRAKCRLLAQRDWYNSQQEGLGDRFYDEILHSIGYLETNYHVPPFEKGSKHVKRYLNPGVFPWLIYFKIVEDHVVIAAFAHPKQRPSRQKA